MSEAEGTVRPMENWREVLGSPGYEVSDQGRVRSLDREITDTLGRHRRLKGYDLKPTRASNGYLTVKLPGPQTACVHVLVALAFIGPRPDGMLVRHWNGDSFDNRSENLRWGTYSENELDAVRHGTHWNARKTHCKYNHEFTPENTYEQAGGGRGCRTCKTEDNKRRWATRKAS